MIQLLPTCLLSGKMKVHNNQLLFEEGDRVDGGSGKEFKVLKVFTGGMQNAGVYKITDGQTEHVLKILINEKSGINTDPLSSVKFNNIVALLNTQIRNLNELGNMDCCGCYVVPRQLYSFKYEDPSDGIFINLKGYIMDYVEGEDVISAIYGKSKEYVYDVCLNLCGLVRKLQGMGYNFKDLSVGNLILDSSSKRIFILDCDNIQTNTNRRIVNNVDVGAKGTGWAIAPEIYFNNARQNANTDSYALAYLLFCFLVSSYKRERNFRGNVSVRYLSEGQYSGNEFKHLLSNGASNITEFAEYCKEEGVVNPAQYLKFVFDPRYPENHWDPSIEKFVPLINNWNELPQKLKELFITAFGDPFEPRRPTANNWESALKEAKNALNPTSTLTNNRTSQVSSQHPQVYNRSVQSKSSDKSSVVPNNNTKISNNNTKNISNLNPRLIIGNSTRTFQGEVRINYRDVGANKDADLCLISVTNGGFAITNLSYLILMVNGKKLVRNTKIEVDDKKVEIKTNITKSIILER